MTFFAAIFNPGVFRRPDLCLSGFTQRMGPLLTILRRLLLPFSWLYGFITDWRNSLYDRGMTPAMSFELPVISIGNLTVGGTGKTPHLEYLIRLLSPSFMLATLSRGYGRRTRGFRIAMDQDTAETLGDEPLQVYQKFGKTVRVTVGEKRAEAIPNIQSAFPEIGAILLDDAYQHRAVEPRVNLLLTDYNHPFYTDHPFPAGNLRERRHGAERADAIIVSKCPPTLTDQEQRQIEQKIFPYAKTPVFFSGIRYAQPVAVHANTQAIGKVILVSGLARPELFEAYAQRQFTVGQHLAFGDHYAYTPKDWQRIEQAWGQSGRGWVLTTEKDAVKLKTLAPPDFPLFVVPIEVYFLENNPLNFDEWLLERSGLHVKKA